MAVASLRDLCFDCADHHRVARFWADVLGYAVRAPDPDDTEDVSVAIDPPAEAKGLRIWFSKVPESKVVKNRVHIDINLSDDAAMARLRELGASSLREIRGDDGALWWTIMADPEGNEFCAFPPRS